MQTTKTVIGNEPITLDEVKEYCKIDYTDEDAIITSLITAARQSIEEFTGLSLIASTIVAYWDSLPDTVLLPYPAHDEVTEVQVNGEVSDNYTQSGLTQFRITPGTVVGSTTESLKVTYTTAGTCPEAVKMEILRLIDERYRNRGNTLVGESVVSLDENSYVNLAQYCVM